MSTLTHADLFNAAVEMCLVSAEGNARALFKEAQCITTSITTAIITSITTAITTSITTPPSTTSST